MHRFQDREHVMRKAAGFVTATRCGLVIDPVSPQVHIGVARQFCLKDFPFAGFGLFPDIGFRLQRSVLQSVKQVVLQASMEKIRIRRHIGNASSGR
ncbi:hypothetical protein D3C80_1882330 [compost metagenome]